MRVASQAGTRPPCNGRSALPPRHVVRIDLESGSLLSMSHAMQTTHDHGIPKTKHAVGPRISLAFRVRPPKDDE